MYNPNPSENNNTAQVTKPRRSFLKNFSMAGLAGLFWGDAVKAQYPSPVHKNDLDKSPFELLSSGEQDRKFWCATLYKIVFPVVEALGRDQLKAKMPLEVPEKYGLNKEVSYLEALGRTMSGLAPWLTLPDDNTQEGKQRKQLREMLLKGLSHAVNPLSKDKMLFEKEAQPIVDAAFVALGFLRAKEAMWQPLEQETKNRWINAFKSLRNRKTAYNNWLLFTGIIEVFLLDIQAGADLFRIDIAIKKMQEWYLGDGWYSDGPQFGMDYYNSFVIHPMLCAIMKVGVEHKVVSLDQYELGLRRMVRQAEFQERMIGPDGYFPVFGRSITYRSAVFHGLNEVVLQNRLPNNLPPGMVRAALTAAYQKMFSGNQNFDNNGWLLLGFNGHQPMVADGYTSTGSLYLCTLGFLALGLPAQHAFWTDAPQKWNALKAWQGEPFHRDYKVNF
jgi:hypothetical protein